MVDGIEPDHVDSTIGADLYVRPLAPTHGFRIANRLRLVPGRSAVRGAREQDLVGTEIAPGELGPRGIDVVSERAIRMGVGGDRVLVVVDRG